MANQKRLKVAIVMGGGVSLGSFTGGALAGVISQLGNNLNKTYATPEIDVLAGSSAGGMTLSLLLRTLANPNPDSNKEDVIKEVAEMQRTAWVDEISIERLIPEIDMKVPSLFDRDVVDSIASKLIKWPKGAKPKPILLGKRVCLGITLLNYNGIPITTSDVPALSDAMSTTLYRDFRVFCLDFQDVNTPRSPRWLSRDASDPKSWQEIAATAIAGGAFPLAFEPAVIERERDEYGDKLWPNAIKGNSFMFTYGDGGTFNNEPLSEAMRMIAFQDQDEEPGSFERILIFVDPNLSGTSEDLSLTFHHPIEVKPGFGWGGDDIVPSDPSSKLVSIGSRLASAIMHQAAYKDFLASSKVNTRLEWREQLRSLLEKTIDKMDDNSIDSVADEAIKSLSEILTEKKDIALSSPEGILYEKELERVRKEHLFATNRSEDHQPFNERKSHQRLFYTLLSLIDQVSGLRRKSQVRVVAIGPTQFTPHAGEKPIPVELAGNFLGNFGGFFRRKFRNYDFRVGQAMAGSILATVSGQPLIKDTTKRPNYERWSGPDPKAEDIPDALERLAARVGHVIEQLIRHKIPIMVLSGMLGKLAKVLSKKAILRITTRDTSDGEVSPVRVVITKASKDSDKFYLEGSDNGDRIDCYWDNRNAVIDTLVEYSANEVSGPHVFHHEGEWQLHMRRHVRARPDESLFLPLSIDKLHEGAGYGLGVLVIEVDWAQKKVEDPEMREELVPLAKSL